MATVYIAPSPAGDDSRSYAQAQVISTPWATPEKTIASAVAGDSVFAASGNYVSATHPSYTKPLLTSALSALGAVFEAASGQGYVARISGSAPSGSWLYDGIVFEANNNVNRCFAFGNNGANDYDLTISNSVLRNATDNMLTIDGERGAITSTNNTYSGTPTTGVTGNAAGLGATGNFTFTSTGDTLDITGVDALVTGFNLRRSSTPTGTVTVSVSDISGSITALPTTGDLVGLITQGVEDVVFSGGELTLTSTDAGSESYGVKIVGVDATANGNNGLIENITVNANIPAGHAVILGNSNTASFMSGGTVNNVTVNGQYYASSSPHGITLGQGTTGAITNSTVVDSYASYLTSKVTTASVTGNTATNPYGVGFYAKGTTAATIDSNTITIDGTQVQRELGLMTAIFQGATDCTAATFSNNTILVADIAAINSLAMISQLAGDAGNAQPATFTNNTYIIPDTVDLGSELLFTRLGVSGQAANQTYAQWLANSEVTGDVVVQKSQSEILALIAGSQTPPTLTSPYSDLTVNLQDVLNIDVTTAWSDVDGYIINGLTYELEDVNGVIQGMVIDSGIRNISVVAYNQYGTNSDSFNIQVISGLPNKITG